MPIPNSPITSADILLAYPGLTNVTSNQWTLYILWAYQELDPSIWTPVAVLDRGALNLAAHLATIAPQTAGIVEMESVGAVRVQYHFTSLWKSTLSSTVPGQEFMRLMRQVAHFPFTV